MTLAFRYAARTDVGLIRDGNEDSGYAGPNLLAVADGMGGAVAGELASAITIETVRQYDSADLDDPVGVLSEAASTANGRILARIKADPRLDGMGTTLTAGVLYDDNVLGVVHIGDSRAYLLRDGELSQLTHDHTFVQSLVDEGKLTPQQAEHHPHRSLIIRVLDGHHDVQLDVDRIELQAGDWLLFCSDGLGNADIRDSMIASAMIEAETPEAAALELIRKALRAGSPDNVTCVVAEVVDLEELGISPDRASVFLGSQPIVVGAAAEPDLDIDQELDQDEVDGAAHAAAPAGPEAVASKAAASNGSAVAAGASAAGIVGKNVDNPADNSGDNREGGAAVSGDGSGSEIGDNVVAKSGDKNVDNPGNNPAGVANSGGAETVDEIVDKTVDNPDAGTAGQSGKAASDAANASPSAARDAASAEAAGTVAGGAAEAQGGGNVAKIGAKIGDKIVDNRVDNPEASPADDAADKIVDNSGDKNVDNRGDSPAGKAGDSAGSADGANGKSNGTATGDKAGDGGPEGADSANGDKVGDKIVDNRVDNPEANAADDVVDEIVDNPGDNSVDNSAGSEGGVGSGGKSADAAADGSSDAVSSSDNPAPAEAGTKKRTSKGLRLALTAMVLSIVGVLAVAGARFAFNWTQQQYYIGSYPASADTGDSDSTTTTADAHQEHVAIFRGVNQKVPGIQLSSVLKVEQITLDQLPASHQRRVEETISVNDLDHAVQLVSELREVADGTGENTSTSPVGDR